MKRLLACLSAALVIAATQMVPASGAPVASPCPLSVVPRDPGWTSIVGPEYQSFPTPNGPPIEHDSIAFTVDPANPQRIFAANLGEVFRTVDGGCSWQKVYVTPSTDIPVLDCGPSAVDLSDVASAGCVRLYDLDIVPGSNRVYLQQYVTRFYGESTSMIMVSDDGGDSWSHLDVAELSAGHGELFVAPGDPSTVYVTRGANGVGFTNGGMAAALSMSRDGGTTWSTISPKLPDRLFLSAERLAVDPSDPDSLWAAASRPSEGPMSVWSHTLVHSEDAGATWREVSSPVHQTSYQGVPLIQDVAVSNPGGAAPRIAIANQTTAFISLDGGTKWASAIPAPPASGALAGLEFNADGNHLFGNTEKNFVMRYDVKRQIAHFIKKRSFVADFDERLEDAVFVSGTGVFLLGECRNGSMGCKQIYRYSGKGT